jgi:thioredoxin reductase
MDSKDHVKVAIVGSGPAGIGAAIGLARRGISPIVIIERDNEIGGIPAKYKDEYIRTFILWTRGRLISGNRFVQRLEQKLAKTDVCIWNECQVIEVLPNKRELTLVNPQRGKFTLTADAIILACGAREKSVAERGWIAGSRSARVLFTHNLLDLLDHDDILPSRKSVILGSDLIAYAAAAKLKKAGASEITMIDISQRPKSSFFQRLYFKRWVNLKWRGLVKSVNVLNKDSVEVITRSDNDHVISCDGIFVCGELVPNSELALLGGFEVDRTSRKPVVKLSHNLSAPGWFVAGNMLGGFHGAEWCYFNGLNTAKSVGEYLQNSNYKGEENW